MTQGDENNNKKARQRQESKQLIAQIMSYNSTTTPSIHPCNQVIQEKQGSPSVPLLLTNKDKK
jgi:hypothetical protein